MEKQEVFPANKAHIKLSSPELFPSFFPLFTLPGSGLTPPCQGQPWIMPVLPAGWFCTASSIRIPLELLFQHSWSKGTSRAGFL